MSAGESAFDVARRQREKAARLQRSADLWERGAAGEVEVARALAQLPPGWTVLHDLAWPGRQRANLDHVVIGPGGVFVVDAKNWSGRIEVSNQVLMQNGRMREPAVASAAEAAIAVQSVVPVANLCMGVLCFVRDEPLTGWARDVMVCSTSNVVAMLTSRPAVLSPTDVQRCVDAVRRAAGARTQAPVRRPPAPPTTWGVPPTDRTVRSRPRRRRGRPVAALVVGVLMVGALASGGLQRASEWFGEQLVTVVSSEAPAPTPTTPVDEQQQRDKKQRDKKQRQQRPANG
ncbi:nuclease-related domain-containing protein [Nocardioides currus]|uniref:NERD domain-containing protein n=1 Tax=Nocardioides currus TaxID=2133958 RepID=A0A2R7Z2Q8_9ACTN|nr:nuclease-related domain-containing protein [Nocardioides currus]PUA82439.1 hypothetical protein C7S10_01420 [Nocardioides currus]